MECPEGTPPLPYQGVPLDNITIDISWSALAYQWHIIEFSDRTLLLTYHEVLWETIPLTWDRVYLVALHMVGTMDSWRKSYHWHIMECPEGTLHFRIMVFLAGTLPLTYHGVPRGNATSYISLKSWNKKTPGRYTVSGNAYGQIYIQYLLTAVHNLGRWSYDLYDQYLGTN